jgi:hypothetical protein
MFGSLRSVPPHEILANTDTIVARDRRLTLRLLEHLHEIDRQKLYLGRGFGSMFEYCTKHLRLAEPSAARRIRTARCVARYPQLYQFLESGDLNLTVVSMVSKYLNSQNVAEIIERITGKSKREVERLIAEYEPRAALPPDRVRAILVPAPPANAARFFTVTGDSEKSPTAESVPHEDRRAGDVQGSPGATVSQAMERLAVIQFTASEEFLALVERVRSIASHRLPPNAAFEQVFALVMKEYVKREDPQERHERRELKKGDAPAAPSKGKSPRQIPVRVRDQVFARDRGRCTYVGTNGRRCDASHVLQIDHIKPVARGGASTIDNLRLLCAYHNRLEAERLVGCSGPPSRAQAP